MKTRQSRYLLIVSMASVLLLYSHLPQSKYQELRSSERNSETDHREILQKRTVRIDKFCQELNNPMRPESHSLYYKGKISHPYVGLNFQVKQRSYSLCTALKAGTSSWEMFLSLNNLTATKIAYCHQGKGPFKEKVFFFRKAINIGLEFKFLIGKSSIVR